VIAAVAGAPAPHPYAARFSKPTPEMAHEPGLIAGHHPCVSNIEVWCISCELVEEVAQTVMAYIHGVPTCVYCGCVMCRCPEIQMFGLTYHVGWDCGSRTVLVGVDSRHFPAI